ncbi:pleckstrin homology domain-containing family M member 1 [Diaphorina citri]|uniref:Pleckstrin homology domain-containing family M member 1 n=1 Tax=Diaphorina citri TaxID=121845 RepID=A0A3Q0JFT3_DIACI|nr:pleckstrin homology domain-containing family M member 1 [Diaphorina citri]
MTSLFRSMVSSKQQDSHFKNAIMYELNNNIKEIQTYPPHSQGKQTTNEVTNALCTTLEALFLHGLRETILTKMSALTSDIIKKPECNFWSVVLIFSHQEIISNISKFNLITNDIGRCRAWLRLAINDSLLVSYLSMMSSESNSLSSMYKKTALLRDMEKLDIAINLLQGILPYEFDLAVNSSLLNIWSDDALILSYCRVFSHMSLTWPSILVSIFSHQEIISNISKFNLITNDIGRCRAWLRLAINDSLLVSYLSMMSSESNSLSSMYKKTALLRDMEKLDIAINLLQGILPYEFDLAVNSSLLNIWSDDALILSGIWSPPMKAAPISSGMDVVKTIKDDIEESLGSRLSLSSFGSMPVSTQDIDEDAAMKLILGTPPSSSKIRTDTSNEKTFNTSETLASEQSDPTTSITKDTQDETNTNRPDEAQIGANIPIENEITVEPNHQQGNSETKKDNAPKLNSGDGESFDTLLNKYNQNNGDTIEDIEKGFNIEELLSQIKARHQVPPSPSPSTHPSIPPTPEPPIHEDIDGFELIQATNASPLNMPEFAYLAQCLFKLSHEGGLKAQNFSCKQCCTPIGMNYKHFCHFTGDYFCEDCFGGKTSIIPARIVFNWDFTERPVCRKASVFLTEIHNHPEFNVKLLNPRLYLVVDKMTQVHYLRMKLNYIKSYLLSCKTTENYLQVQLWPREYLYETLHVFSLLDLKEIRAGTLEVILNYVIAAGTKHIASCDLCKLKGHICELCGVGSDVIILQCYTQVAIMVFLFSVSNTEEIFSTTVTLTTFRDVIFPFDLERTHTCRECRATFHKVCYKGEILQCYTQTSI